MLKTALLVGVAVLALAGSAQARDKNPVEKDTRIFLVVFPHSVICKTNEQTLLAYRAFETQSFRREEFRTLKPVCNVTDGERHVVWTDERYFGSPDDRKNKVIPVMWSRKDGGVDGGWIHTGDLGLRKGTNEIQMGRMGPDGEIKIIGGDE